jgi:branched-chain amino acid transport system substrate-binding protein
LTSRRSFVFSAAFAAAFGVLACAEGCKSGGGAKDPNGPILVGAYLSLSGSDTTFGSDSREGIDLALEQVNAAGGIKGRQVKVMYEDDRSTTQEATNKVQQLIDRDHVVAILGEVASSRSIAGGIVCNKKRVPMVTPSSTAVDVTVERKENGQETVREYVFRACFTDTQQGNVAARFVKDTLAKNSVAILYVAQDTYSSGLAKSFRESFEKLGGKITIDKGYKKGEGNFTTYLNDVKATNPEVIFAPVYYSDMVQIAKQAKDVGIAGSMFVGGDGWDSSNLLEGAGDLLEGAHFTNHYAPDVPWKNAQTFLGDYKKKYGRDPTSLAAQAFDAAALLFDAMKRAPQVTSEAIKVALAETKDFAGATGSLTVDKDHNTQKPIVVVEIKNKKFTFSTQLAPN